MAEQEKLEILLQLQDQLSKGLNNASKNVSSLGTKLQKTSQKLKTMGTNMTNVGKQAAIKFAIAGAAIGGMISVFAGYEKQMSKVKAISGATEKEFSLLKNTARGLGATTKFSAKQAGEGMEFLALAGYNTNQTIAAMPGLLNLAAAGQLDLGKASDLVTDILSQYGLQAEYATNASDLFAKVQATANTNVELLGSAILAVGGTAKNAGVSLEETASIIGLLADQGLKGSAAGTAMNRMILDMVKKSGQLKKMGIDVYDLNGEFRSMADIVGDVEKAIAGKTAQEAMAIKMQVTGIFGQQSLNRLLQAGSNRMREFTAASSDNTGVAKKMADTMEDNLVGSITKLKSALQEAMIAISEQIMPVIKLLVSTVQGLTDKFNNLSPGVKKFIGYAALVATAITGITAVVLLLIGSFMKLKAFMITMNVFLAANPFVLIATAIAAVIAASILLYANWDKVVKFFKDTLKKIPEWFEVLKNKAIEIAGILGGIFLDLGKIIFYAMTGQFGKIKDAFTELNEGIREIMTLGRENIVADETTAQEEKLARDEKAAQDKKDKEENANIDQLAAIEAQNIAKAAQEAAYQAGVLQKKQAQEIQEKQKAIQKFNNAMQKQRTLNSLTVQGEQKKLDLLYTMEGKAGVDQVLLQKEIKKQLKNLDIAHNNEKKAREEKMKDFNIMATVKGFSGMLSSLISFRKNTGKEYRALFNILKGVKIAEATVNTWAGATAALAGPFPLNLINMGVVLATGFANVASIVATSLAGGTASVPGFGNADTVPANLTPGEMVTPKGFAESIRSGELTLSGPGETSEAATTVQVNINDPIFYGDPDLDFVKEIFRVAGEGISQNLISPLPEGV